MAESYVDVIITTDAETLADEAVARLQAAWPGWEPNDADLEVIQIETLAPMAADAAETTVQVPPAIFRAFGTKLARIPYLTGTAAVTTIEVTFDSDDEAVLEEGFEVIIDGSAFRLLETVTKPEGDAVLSGVVVAAEDVGAAANGLPGTVVEKLSAAANILTITADPTTGGTDPELDVDYLDRLASELELQARTLVTPRDYELMALGFPNVGRALALHDGERAVSVTTTTFDGTVLDDLTKDAIVAKYADYRLVNTVVTMLDATYTTVTVTAEVKAYPGFDTTTLQAQIEAVLDEELSPATHGRQRSFGDVRSLRWLNEPKVRRNKLIDAIGDIDGVDYVDTLTISGSAGTVDSAGNLTMPGTVPLPVSGSHVVDVT